MKLEQLSRAVRLTSSLQDLNEGFRYVIGHRMIRSLISLVVVTSLFGVSFIVLLPAWAVKALHGGATTNGWMYSARGAGALLGALLIASLGRFDFRGRLLTLGSFLFPSLLIAFAWIHWLPLTIVVLIPNGAAAIMIFNLANALIQTLVRDGLRGRVMSLYSLTFFGFLPIGALWIGAVAQHFGETAAILVNGGLLFVFCSLIALLVPGLRRLE